MEQPAILSDQKIQTWKAKLQKWNFQQNGQNDFIKKTMNYTQELEIYKENYKVNFFSGASKVALS